MFVGYGMLRVIPGLKTESFTTLSLPLITPARTAMLWGGLFSRNKIPVKDTWPGKQKAL
jgi:hypothetical protein